MRRLLVAALSVALVIFNLFPLSSLAAPPNSPGPTVDQQVIDQINANGETTFLVVLRDRPSLQGLPGGERGPERRKAVVDQLKAAADRSQGGVKADLDGEVRAGKAKGYKSFWIVNSFAVTGGKDTLDKLTKRPDIERIEAQHTFHLDADAQTKGDAAISAALQWNITKINADKVWELGVDGAGVVVGSLDTGVQYNHPALINQYRGNLHNGRFDHNYNWIDLVDTSPSNIPVDDYGHGTHTMGTMVGSDGGAHQIGVAPGATWIAAKVFDSTGHATTSSIIAGFQWMLAPTDLQGNNPDPSKAPDVVNNSWGDGLGSDGDTVYQESVRAWVQAGIVPVFAAGNDYCRTPSTLESPGSYPESFAVGATTNADAIADFSSCGPSPLTTNTKPDVSAPGQDVNSSLPGNSYGPMSGTSMATPHVTGLVALMLQANPLLGVSGVEDAIRKTAVHLGSTSPNMTYGYGRIDAFAAVKRVRGMGVLKGIITSAAPGASPVAGAVVTAVMTTGTFSDTTRTATSGAYSLSLPTGTYTVTVDGGFRYYPRSASGVSIGKDSTVTRNLALDPKPTGTIAGTVKELGTDSPMSATVTLQGTDISATTDPATGAYHLDLVPVGSYTVVASSYPLHGMQVAGGIAVTGGGVAGQDFALPRRYYYNDFESGPAGFTHRATGSGTDYWLRSTKRYHSPNRAFFAQDPATVNDNYLISPAIALTAGSQFSFWHTYQLENQFDGAVLEISTDGGSTWSDLGPHIITGGYDATISSAYGNPIGGREAWTGGIIGSMTRVDVDLSSYAGQTVKIRFRLASDNSTASTGWYVDDVAVYGAAAPGIVPSGSIAINGGATYASSAAVTLTVTSTNASLVRFANGAAGWRPWEAVAPTRSWNLPAGDGTKVVRAQFYDGVTLSDVVTASIVLDSQAPAGSISINNGAATARSITATLSLSATDATNITMRIKEVKTDGTLIRDSGAWAPFTASYSWPMWNGPDGTRTIMVRYRDANGNLSPWYQSTIQFVRGKAALLAPAADVVVTDTTPTFSWKPVTDASGYQLIVKRVDTGVLVTNRKTSGTSVTLVKDLPRGVRYQWRVKALVDGVWTCSGWRYFKVK